MYIACEKIRKETAHPPARATVEQLGMGAGPVKRFNFNDLEKASGRFRARIDPTSARPDPRDEVRFPRVSALSSPTDVPSPELPAPAEGLQ
jgi:hypothetical protein